MKKPVLAGIVLATLALVLGGFFNRDIMRDSLFMLEKPTPPKTQLYESFEESTSATLPATPQESQKNSQPKSHDREIWVDKNITRTN